MQNSTQNATFIICIYFLNWYNENRRNNYILFIINNYLVGGIKWLRDK